MTVIINRADLPADEIGWEFQGVRYSNTNASFILVDAPPGTGPRLHSHPYEEIFILLEGKATFTAGDTTVEASGGQIVIVPAGVPHKFVNSGTERLRQIDIHPSPRMITTWLDD